MISGESPQTPWVRIVATRRRFILSSIPTIDKLNRSIASQAALHSMSAMLVLLATMASVCGGGSSTPPSLKMIKPEHETKCEIGHTAGCFNDSDWNRGPVGPVLSTYVPSVAGKPSKCFLFFVHSHIYLGYQSDMFSALIVAHTRMFPQRQPALS